MWKSNGVQEENENPIHGGVEFFIRLLAYTNSHIIMRTTRPGFAYHIKYVFCHSKKLTHETRLKIMARRG